MTNSAATTQDTAAALCTPCRDDAPVVTIESDPEAWSTYVSIQEGAVGYHDWRWRNVFKGAFGYDSIYFAARRDGRIAGVLPTVLLDMTKRVPEGVASLTPTPNRWTAVKDSDGSIRHTLDKLRARAMEAEKVLVAL